MAVGYGFVSCSCACAEHTDVQGAKAHGYRLKHMNIYTRAAKQPLTPRGPEAARGRARLGLGWRRPRGRPRGGAAATKRPRARRPPRPSTGTGTPRRGERGRHRHPGEGEPAPGGGVLSPRPLPGALPAPSRWLRPPRSRPEVVPGASRLSAGPSWASSGLWLRFRIAQGPRSALLASHPRAWGEAGCRIDKKPVPCFSGAAPEGTRWRLFAWCLSPAPHCLVSCSQRWLTTSATCCGSSMRRWRTLRGAPHVSPSSIWRS